MIQTINHAPKRKEILNLNRKKLASKNAFRYFDPSHHHILASEFAEELKKKKKKKTDASTCIVFVPIIK